MALYVICASPLVKSFLPEWHKLLMEEPDLINDAITPFDFDIQRGTCAFKVKFNKPVECIGKNDRETQNLFNWLTGGANGVEFPETDCWGMVPFNPNVNLTERLDEINRLEAFESDDPKALQKATKELQRIQLDMKERMKATRGLVKQLSEERILRAMRNTHQNLLKQWRVNEEMKLGRHAPSVGELMGAHALGAEQAKKKETNKKLLDRMNDLMKNEIV